MKKVIYTPLDNDVLNLYMRDIRKNEILTNDEEARLSALISKGGRAGKRALDKLVNANLRFAVFMAKQYMGRGNELNDLIQDASQGLVEAAKLFDASHGVRFISFASAYVRKYIVLGIQRNSSVIRKPKDFYDANAKYLRLTEKAGREDCSEPTLDEFEMASGLSHEKAVVMFDYISQRTLSLDAPYEDSECCLGDFICDTCSADRETEQKLLRSYIDQVCFVLKERTRNMLYDIFGLNTGYSLTNVEIADKYNVDAEQIRKIKARALEKVRRTQLKCA